MTSDRWTGRIRVRAAGGAVLLSVVAFAQTSEPPPLAPEDRSPSTLTESNTVQISGSRFWDRVWISGQVNSITQYHPDFRSPYSGPNSMLADRETASSRVFTLYTVFRINNSTDVLLHVESAGGSGLSSALGMAGFTNLDVVRNPTLGSKPYAARYILRHIVGLSRETTEVPAGPFGLIRQVPVRRIELRFGRLSTADFFDLNSVGSDSHLQFMNWTIDNNGAYDYAADTRGYTYGALLEYYDRRWAARFMEALMPAVANGMTLDWNLAQARAENAELQLQYGVLPGKDGTIRLLGYVNHANMGSYRDAIESYLAGDAAGAPDVTVTRRQGRVKYGFGLNIEQRVRGSLQAFARCGWNEGRHESFAYTEVNETAATGAHWSGSVWKRRRDQVGVAAVWNAISGDHRRYLELGGTGFLLGDGRLNYGREHIAEAYYNWSLGRGMSLTFDVQRVANPGYNRDRGPVLVPSVRFHVDIDRSSFATKGK